MFRIYCHIPLDKGRQLIWPTNRTSHTKSRLDNGGRYTSWYTLCLCTVHIPRAQVFTVY